MSHPDSERSIERLIKLAGGRDMPSAEGTERARLAAHQAWSRMLEQPAVPVRSRLKAMLAFAAAAGIVAVVTWMQRPEVVAPVVVARIAALTGDVLIQQGRADISARVTEPIHAGATLLTGDSRVALTFGDSLSLRIDRHTRVRFDSREKITLLSGALYVDSGGINAVPALHIETPAGDVRHVGTQFQVRVTGDLTVVRVREGRVLLTGTSGLPTDITAGDELQVSRAGLGWERGRPSFGEDWEWSAGIAPALEIENRPLAEFISWIAREHGWQVRYADATLQARAVDIRLHGSLDQVDGAAMLDRVTLVTGVPLQARDGVLQVGK
jgi:transmembrane sensor